MKNVAVICDFGIAKISTGIKASDVQVIYNIDGLSPKYCPPESFTLLTNDKSVDPQVLSFSFLSFSSFFSKNKIMNKNE